MNFNRVRTVYARCFPLLTLIAGLIASASAAMTPPGTAPPPPVQQLLERWVDAQNRGAFDDYATFYSTRFHGVRRSGVKTVEFDRAGWLTDRRRMFRRKISVSVTELAVVGEPTASRIELRFVQRFSSGTYADIGPKRMILTNGNGATWQIEHEELLQSSRLTETPSPEATSPEATQPRARPAETTTAAPPAASPTAATATAQVPPGSRAWPGFLLEGLVLLMQEPAPHPGQPGSGNDGEQAGLLMTNDVHADATFYGADETLRDIVARWTAKDVMLLDSRGRTCTTRIVSVSAYHIGRLAHRCRPTQRVSPHGEWLSIAGAEVEAANCAARSRWAIAPEQKANIYLLKEALLHEEEVREALVRGNLGPVPEDPACTIVCGGYATADGRVALSGLIYCPNQPARRLLARRIGARFVSEPPLRGGSTQRSQAPRALKLELQGPSKGLLAPFLIDFDLDGKLDIPAGDGYVSGADLGPQELSIPSLMCCDDDC